MLRRLSEVDLRVLLQGDQTIEDDPRRSFNKEPQRRAAAYGHPHEVGQRVVLPIHHGVGVEEVAQQQAKLYADCLEAQYDQRPIIFYSNGYETFMAAMKNSV